MLLSVFLAAVQLWAVVMILVPYEQLAWKLTAWVPSLAGLAGGLADDSPEHVTSCSGSHGGATALTEKTLVSARCLLDGANLSCDRRCWSLCVFYIPFTEVQFLPSGRLEAPLYDIADINVV